MDSTEELTQQSPEISDIDAGLLGDITVTASKDYKAGYRERRRGYINDWATKKDISLNDLSGIFVNGRPLSSRFLYSNSKFGRQYRDWLRSQEGGQQVLDQAFSRLSDRQKTKAMQKGYVSDEAMSSNMQASVSNKISLVGSKIGLAATTAAMMFVPGGIYLGAGIGLYDGLKGLFDENGVEKTFELIRNLGVVNPNTGQSISILDALKSGGGDVLHGLEVILSALPIILEGNAVLGKPVNNLVKNQKLNRAVRSAVRNDLPGRAKAAGNDYFRLGKSSTPDLIENGIQHTQSFTKPTTAINNGNLIPTPVNNYMGNNTIWWTTKGPYQKGADVIILTAENGSGATSDLIGGFARDASWRQTTGLLSTNGMITSVKDPLTGVYTHTDLTPGVYTASKGSSWYTFPLHKIGGTLNYIEFF